MDTTEDVMTAGRATPSPFRRPAPKPVLSARGGSLHAPALQPAPAARAMTTAGASGATAQAVTPVSVKQAQRERLRQIGARWFFWVGALTLINAVMPFTGQTVRFVIGLGTTQIVTGLAARSGRGWAPAILLDLIFIGGFFLLGHLALKGQRWAYAVGIAVYGLDGLIFLLGHRWMGLGFHLFVLFMMIKGFQAARPLDPHARASAPTVG